MSAIDTSYWQHYPDYNQVAAFGVTLVVMKCADGEGGSVVYDSVYRTNRAAARNAGLRVGSYYFNGNAASPTQAADDQWSVIDWRLGDIVAIDVEGGSSIVWSVGQTLEWVNRMRAHGVPAGNILVYMSSSLTRQNWSSVIATGVGLWVASYGANNPADIGPNGSPYVGQWGSYAMWQHSSVAHVPGIVGYVDMNVINSTTAGLGETIIGEDMPLDVNDKQWLNGLGAAIIDQVSRAVGPNMVWGQPITHGGVTGVASEWLGNISDAVSRVPVTPVIDSAALAIAIAQHMNITAPTAPPIDMLALSAALEAVVAPHFAALPAAVNMDAAARLAT